MRTGSPESIQEGGSGYGKNVWHAEKLSTGMEPVPPNQGFCKVCVAAMRESVKDHDPFPAPAW